MPEFIDSLKRRVGLPDSQGLYHSTKHLKEIRTNFLEMDILEMAKYSDSVCRKMVKSNDPKVFAQMEEIYQLPHSETPTFRENLNATALGNIAYISLNCHRLEVFAAGSYFLKSIN